jgi:hypothetical protein
MAALREFLKILQGFGKDGKVESVISWQVEKV